MKNSKCLRDGVGLLLCAALLGALTGCTTYVEQPRSRSVYYPETPRPREVPAPPPVQYVERPAVVVDAYVGIRTEDDFYEPLSPYGRWEVVGTYGRCWIPTRVEAGWRPYSHGYWQRTEDGWYWASEEPWAWATYHYGRWDFTERYGWYWVPQTQWAPAWVSWHRGGGYVGWAPLYPSARIASGGVVAVNVQLIAPQAYVFVEERRFMEPVRPTTVVVNNTTIIKQTVNITNIKVVNNTVINEGPRTTIIEQASGQKVQAVPVRDLRRKQEANVVARQRTATPAGQHKTQPPVRSEAAPRETKTVPASEPRPLEQPAAVTSGPGAPAPQEQSVEPVRVQPVPAPAETKAERKREAKPEVPHKTKPAARPEAGRIVRERAVPAPEVPPIERPVMITPEPVATAPEKQRLERATLPPVSAPVETKVEAKPVVNPEAGRHSMENEVIPLRRPVAKPVEIKKEQPSPAAKIEVRRPHEQKPSAKSAQPPTPPPASHEPQTETARPAGAEAAPSAEVKTSTHPETHKQAEIQMKSGKKQPAAGKQGQNDKKKDEKKKSKEPETPPEEPAVQQ